MTKPAAVRFKIEVGTKGRRDATVRHPPPESAPETTAPPAEAKHNESRLPSRTARMLALGHLIERLIHSGDLPSYAEAARRFGVTRARMSQITNLTLLAPSIQEDLLLGRLRIAERELRHLIAVTDWQEQQKRVNSLDSTLHVASRYSRD